ncbi:MAG TPA: isochorismatase family protein [Candidatus Tectomicrobia bacterium]
MAIWDDVLTERDQQVFAAAGYGKRQGFGRKPAVIVVDVNYNFVGDVPEPILESIKKYRNSCGEEGWQGVYQISRLLDGARDKKVPIFYSTAPSHRVALMAGRWHGKNSRGTEDFQSHAQDGNAIVREIAPHEGDIVILKDKPSVFFGTPLMSYLHELQVDTLLVAGTTTSGCVRATVVDAFSYNFKVVVVEECVFDRGQTSHKVNLFDMQAKYADVVPLEVALSYMDELASDLHAPQRLEVSARV